MIRNIVLFTYDSLFVIFIDTMFISRGTLFYIVFDESVISL